MGARVPGVWVVGGVGGGVGADDDLWEWRVGVAGPRVEDGVGRGVAAYRVRRGGLAHNATTGRSVDNIRRGGGRAKVYYRGTGFDVLVSADYQRERSECCSAIPVTWTPTVNVFGAPIASLLPDGSHYVRQTVQNGRNLNYNSGDRKRVV